MELVSATQLLEFVGSSEHCVIICGSCERSELTNLKQTLMWFKKQFPNIPFGLSTANIIRGIYPEFSNIVESTMIFFTNARRHIISVGLSNSHVLFTKLCRLNHQCSPPDTGGGIKMTLPATQVPTHWISTNSKLFPAPRSIERENNGNVFWRIIDYIFNL